MIPIFDREDKVARFMNFLKDTNETIKASLCRFEQNQWNIDITSLILYGLKLEY